MIAATKQFEVKNETESGTAEGGTVKERSLVDLMRDAVDGSGSFMSRRAQQILLTRYRIRVVQ